MVRPVAPEVLVALEAAGLTPRAVVLASTPGARARADALVLAPAVPVVPGGQVLLAAQGALVARAVPRVLVAPVVLAPGVLGLVVAGALAAAGVAVLAVGSRPVGIGDRPAVGTDRGRVGRVVDRGTGVPGIVTRTGTTTGADMPGHGVMTRLSGIRSAGSCPIVSSAMTGETAVVGPVAMTWLVATAAPRDVTTARAPAVVVPGGIRAASAGTSARMTAAASGGTTGRDATTAALPAATTVPAATAADTVAMSAPQVGTGVTSARVVATAVGTGVTSARVVAIAVGTGVTSVPVVAIAAGTGVTSVPAAGTAAAIRGPRVMSVVGGMSVVGISGMTGVVGMSGRLGTGSVGVRRAGVGRPGVSVGRSGGTIVAATRVGVRARGGTTGTIVAGGTSAAVGLGVMTGARRGLGRAGMIRPFRKGSPGLSSTVR